MKLPSDPLAAFRSGKFPDRTRRAYDVIRQHFEDHGPVVGGWWIAIRLSDGGSDGKLYRDKRTATRFQLHERQCAYICIPPFGEMPIEEVHQFLSVNERLYDQGARLSDEGTYIVPRSMQ